MPVGGEAVVARLPFRRWAALVLMVAGLSGCTQDGHLTIAGYTTAPNYDTSIHTVRVPIFQNQTYIQGVEFDLTREVIRQIEAVTPYKVVQGDAADTELLGNITVINKNILNRNQLNEVREAETVLQVELIWRNIHTGEILSRPRQGPGAPPENVKIATATDPLAPAGAGAPPGAPDGPPVPGALPAVPGVLGPELVKPFVVVASLGNFVPELGESVTTSLQKNIRRMATQIVSMMETPW